MTRPGYAFTLTSTPPARGFSTDTGAAFLAATALIGRSDRAVLCHNLSDVVAAFGPRDTQSLLYDTADTMFRCGVVDLYIGRRVGPAAEPATVTLKDGAAADSVTVSSIGPGTSTLEVQPVAGTVANSIQLVITDTATGKVVETSPSALTVADLVGWSQFKAKTVTVTAIGADLPAAGAAVALAGGDADNANVTDATLADDLAALFPSQLGPGQVVVPGATSTAAHVAMANHAQLTNRFALWDGADSGDATAQVTAVQAIQTSPDIDELAETYGMFWAPWRVVPGLTQLTTRTVPPSAVVAGLIAASDATTGNTNVPAAGANGIDPVSLSSSQPEWTDAQRETLNDGGVNVFHLVGDGTQRAYGWRTGAIDDGTNDGSAAWLSAGAARLRMSIVNDLSILAESYLFAQLDGQGQKVAAFGGAISGVLNRYWAAGALYGTTADAAFSVDVGPTVNTPDTLANNELHARIGIKVSPFAEMIYFDINKAALTATTV